MNRILYDRNHPHKSRESESLYENIGHFIDEHIEEELSMNRLSNEFFVSKYHIYSHYFLCKYFPF